MSTITAVITPVFAQADPNAFWSTQIGEAVKGILAAVGVIIVIFALVKAVGNIAQGKIGPAVKVIFFAAVLAAFMFAPELLTDLVGVVRRIIESLLGSAEPIINNNGGGTPAPPAP